jgi:hypothetical protein
VVGDRLWRAAHGPGCHQDSRAFRKGSDGLIRKGSDGLNCLQAPSVSRFSFPPSGSLEINAELR